MGVTFYGTDLAYVHDVGFDFIARGATPAIVARLRDAGIRDGLIVELGCGSGIAAGLFTDAGYDVVGVDQSADLLAIARERAPGVRYVHASLHDFELPGGCAAVVAMGEIFNYAGIRDDLFPRVREALAPGGLLVFDAAAPGRAASRAWFEDEGWVVCVDAHADGARLSRRIATFRAVGGDAWRRSDEVHELTLYDPHWVVGEMTAAGLEDARVLPEGYGPGIELPDGLPVYAARAYSP